MRFPPPPPQSDVPTAGEMKVEGRLIWVDEYQSLSQSLGPLRLRGGSSRDGASISIDGASSDDSPQLIYQSDRTAIYRLRDAGFKVIIEPNPSDERHLKLLHEQHVSNLLPASCRRREVTDITSFDRRPSLNFKWVSGITLKEWLQKVRSDPHVKLNVRVRAAMAVAKTLSDFHQGGVVYNGLTTDNVVLSPLEDEYVATFIDLSDAIIYRDGGEGNCRPESEIKQLKAADLRSLGVVLNQILGGGAIRAGDGTGNEKVLGHDEEDISRKKRASQPSFEELPLYFVSLVSALLETSMSPGMCYESAQDVYLDIKAMAEDTSGHLSKSNLDETDIKNLLYSQKNMFYGRKAQMTVLMNLLQSSAAIGNQHPLMATITGSPGTGKSTLVNQIRKPLKDLSGYFIEGKFDKHARPDTVLASAIDSFFGKIVESKPGNSMESMKWRIHDAIGSGSISVLPNLQKWLNGESDTNQNVDLKPTSGIGSSLRLKFMFCNIIGAVASKNSPLVMFLDDLQWADEITLDVLRMMMTDPDIKHFLFLGSYRDNEVGIYHPLTDNLRAIQGQGVSIVNVKIGPIEKESVTTLVSEALCMPPSLCRSLANVIHNKTGGIILFILRFLASLNDDRDLWFSMGTRMWMYNLEDISLKEIHGDVVSYMTEHMKSLSSKISVGLKFAACLGPTFDAKVLENAQTKTEFDDAFLDLCVDFGYLRRVTSNKYIWAHDQIQQAAYDLIPLDKRESFHLLVGSRLLIATLPAERDGFLFYIVDNINRGSKLIEDAEQRYDAAQLNLDAGEKALSASAFHSAVNYLVSGLSLLGPESWDVKYELTIRLYDAASEALFVIGDFARLLVLMEEPLTKARSFEDKLNNLNNFVRTLAASNKFEEGISKCMGILTRLGEVIPTDITAGIYAAEVTQVKNLLRNKSREYLLTLPVMQEAHKLAAMQFMNHALPMTFSWKPLLNPIIVFRMVKMSVEHGVCNTSPFAFACYGGWLVTEPTFDVEGGYRMGRVAVEMMKRIGADDMMPRIYTVVYGFINIWKEPWQASQSKYMDAYEAAVTMGDMEFALHNISQCTATAIYSCGKKLASLSQDIAAYAKRAYQCNQRSGWIWLVILQQLTFDLIGINENAFTPYSTGTTEDSCFNQCREDNLVALCRFICNKKKFVAFFNGHMDTAAQMCDLSKEFPTGVTGRTVPMLISTFIDGLIGFFFARKHREDEPKWTTVGLEAVQSFRNWVQHSNWNFNNKLFLLEAEYYFLRGDEERALFSYHASIKAAHIHRFIHEEGLAEEKLAVYLLQKGKHDAALSHFKNAKQCYGLWEAGALVKRVENAIAILLPLCTGS